MYYSNIQKQSSFWNTYTTWTRARLVLHKRQYFGFERACCRLIQKSVVGLTFDMYVFISNVFSKPYVCDKLYWTQNCGWMIIWQFFLMFCVDTKYQDGCHRMAHLTSYLVEKKFFSGTIKPLYKMYLYNMFVFYVDQEWSLLHHNSSTWPNG